MTNDQTATIDRSLHLSPALLVSVRTAGEARQAIACGIDLLDVKDPAGGSLGRPHPQTVDEIMHQVRILGQAAPPVTMALGELRDLSLDDREPPALPDGVQGIKLGLAGCRDLHGWLHGWCRWKRQLERDRPRPPAWIAVIYADAHLAAAPSALEVIAAAVDLGCRGVLVDTFSKKEGNLWTFVTERELDDWSDRVHQQGMFLAVAGGLELSDLPRLGCLSIDVVGVRGSVCHQGCRESELDPTRVRRWRESLAEFWPGGQRDGVRDNVCQALRGPGPRVE